MPLQRKTTETYIESVKCELNGETELSKNDEIIIQLSLYIFIFITLSLFIH